MTEKYTLEDVIITAPTSYDRSFKMWHKTAKYSIPDTGAKMHISDLFGGCSMQQIHGWHPCHNNPAIKVI